MAIVITDGSKLFLPKFWPIAIRWCIDYEQRLLSLAPSETNSRYSGSIPIWNYNALSRSWKTLLKLIYNLMVKLIPLILLRFVYANNFDDFPIWYAILSCTCIDDDREKNIENWHRTKTFFLHLRKCMDLFPQSRNAHTFKTNRLAKIVLEVKQFYQFQTSQKYKMSAYRAKVTTTPLLFSYTILGDLVDEQWHAFVSKNTTDRYKWVNCVICWGDWAHVELVQHKNEMFQMTPKLRLMCEMCTLHFIAAPAGSAHSKRTNASSLK